MEIQLDSGERLSFTWRNSGELFVALVKDAPSGAWNEPKKQYPVTGSCTLRGENLIQFLEGFCVPMLRRALQIAVKFPAQGEHTAK